MSDSTLFSAGQRLGDPAGDPNREAIASLRGYTYQLYASVLAWLRLGDGETLYLEVAEDYAVAAAGALEGVQVRDTPSSTITIRSVAPTIDAFVDLVERNAASTVSLRYLTTSVVGLERASTDRIDDGPALEYWQHAAKGAPVAPLRAVLLSLNLARKTIDFINACSDDELRDTLIRRLHWDAGQAPLDDLAEELEAGLVEFAVGTLRLSADIGRRMANLALANVLKVTVRSKQRRLRRADLIELGESLGRVSVPRTMLEALIGKTGNGQTRESFLFPGEILSTGPVAPRDQLVAVVRDAVAQSSFAIVGGSTGMGKTYVASKASIGRPGGWQVADLRGIAAQGAVSRLTAILGEAAVSESDIILLDDLECLDDPGVLRGVRRLVVAMRRRDGAVIVTCASPPARRTMEAICGSPSVAIDVPYLTIEEVADLISQVGGNPGMARMIYLAGSAGHPQLVQAAILHMRSANWERAAIRNLFDGMANDIAEEKRVARDRLVSAMPQNARAMLYRVSLIFGRFTRELALKLGDVDPNISEPGTEIDRLVGPWIERPYRDELRVSPLVANAGNAALSPAECVRVHQAVADHYLRSGSLSVSQGDAILHHALTGGDDDQVFAYADSLVTTPSDILDLLARYSPSIAALTTDGPIYPANSFLSVMLRLGQLLVVLSSDDVERAKEVWAATRREMADESEKFEVLVLSKIFIQTVVVQAIPDWLEFLLRFDALCQTNKKLIELADEIGKAPGANGCEPQGFAFIFQATALGSTGLLRATFERLDEETPEVRERLFSGLERGAGHYGHLVDAAWLRSAKIKGFNGEQAADDYLAMANLARGWDNCSLAARCHAARAIMLEEFVNDPARALAALDEAQAQLGPMTAISRVRARVQWRQRDHRNALRGLEEVWIDAAADSDEVERGFIAREAGISAADIGDWPAARTWFARARACFEPFDSGTLPALKIGLVADGAHAAFKSGDTVGAVEGYTRALVELCGLDPDSSLNAAYCHRVVRHSVLWLMRETRDTELEVALAELPPGACSNPEPKEEIRTVPLAPIDLAWYMLADAALDLGQADFFDRIHDRLTDGPIVGLEAERQYRLAKHVVARGDGARLVAALKPYGAALAYLEAEHVELMAGDICNPNRGSFPLYLLDGTEPAPVTRGAGDLLVSFGILRAIAGDAESLRRVRAAVGGDDWSSVRGFAKLMIGAEGKTSLPIEYTAATIAEVTGTGGRPVDPVIAIRATIHFTIWASSSAFRNQLAEPVGVWVAEIWQAIVDAHRFRLRNPVETAGEIAAALASTGDPLVRAARIALAADPAVPIIVPRNVRSVLAALAAT